MRGAEAVRRGKTSTGDTLVCEQQRAACCCSFICCAHAVGLFPRIHRLPGYKTGPSRVGGATCCPTLRYLAREIHLTGPQGCITSLSTRDLRNFLKNAYSKRWYVRPPLPPPGTSPRHPKPRLSLTHLAVIPPRLGELVSRRSPPCHPRGVGPGAPRRSGVQVAVGVNQPFSAL